MAETQNIPQQVVDAVRPVGLRDCSVVLYRQRHYTVLPSHTIIITHFLACIAYLDATLDAAFCVPHLYNYMYVYVYNGRYSPVFELRMSTSRMSVRNTIFRSWK